MEKLMIAKLKSECGQQFTSKIEGMLLDMNLSKEIMESYKQTEYFSTCPIEMDVCNLTSSHWSLKMDNPIAVPPAISDGQGRFTAYYIEKFRTGRRLMWLLNMGTADVRATFKSGKKELNVTTYQMCILMLFNSVNSLTLDQIRNNCAIPEKGLTHSPTYSLT
jgi:cullin 3